ncbi:hypothetical protein AB0J86_04945 [Micromonospora sp. NPDC049559]|uniref:hypothetical protein n=1 Tax=Micromonospora sp. NPDC049559 TaxID=3155923 RepID=UPI00343AC2FC
MTLKAAIEALYYDADIWEDISGVTNEASSAAAGLTLTEGQLSWACIPTGLLDTYEAIRAKAQMLLTEGTTNMSDMAATLRKVAKAYEISDESASRRFDGEWEPVR